MSIQLRAVHLVGPHDRLIQLLLHGETRIPTSKCVTEAAVDQLGTYLQEQMRPIGDLRICCDVGIRLSINWLTADSMNAVEMC